MLNYLFILYYSQDLRDPPQHLNNRLSRVEKARLEALQSFGGNGLGDVMTEAKTRVARTLEVKRKEPDHDEPGPDSSKGGELLQEIDKENLINQVTT